MLFKNLLLKVDFPLRRLLLIGLLLEFLIFTISYTTQTNIEVVFRYTARYSGRLSFFVFVFTFFLFANSCTKTVQKKQQVKNWITLFAVLHIIHFGFLATSVYLNNISLEGIKVIGGLLAYLMIITAPFKFYKLKSKLQLVYFYYVSLVMALTYVARIKGDFPGAQPSWYHYFGLATILLSAVLFGFWIRKK